MVQYDPNVIQSFAEGMYAKSFDIARRHAVVWSIMGIIAGCFAGAAVHPVPNASAMVVLFGAAIGGLVGGAIGHRRGMDKSFHLRLQAQLTLCQLMIEMNTRQAAVGRVPMQGPGQPQGQFPRPEKIAG